MTHFKLNIWMNEEWKNIIGYENYQISNFGNVKNKKGNILKFSKNKDGYCQINIYKNLKQKCFKVHRLVALHFIDNPNNLEFVNHIDSNKSNNCYFNLEWITHFENCTHRELNKNNSSDFYGVTFDKTRNRWKAQIKIKNKTKFLGRFNTEIEAFDKIKYYHITNNIINKYLNYE